MMRFLLKDETGKASLTFSMTVLSFGAIFLWLVFWIVGTALELEVPAFSATEATVFLSPIFALYFGRKGQKGKATEEQEK